MNRGPMKASCGSEQKQIQFSDGTLLKIQRSDAFIENHTSGILDYESISYEEYAGAGVMSIGPHEPFNYVVFNGKELVFSLKTH